jgi:hypothetical protein
MLAVWGAGGAFAAEKLGPDGFPAGWTAEDFAVVSGTIAKPGFAQGGSGKSAVSATLAGSVKVSGTALKSAGAVLKNGEAVVESAGVVTAPAPAALPTLDGFGVLTVASGGAGADVWQKAGRGVQDERLGRALDGGVASPALREAWRRVLLAQAAAPAVAAGEGVSGSLPLWLGVRATALEKLGFYEAAWSLWRPIPAELARHDTSLTYGWAQARLLAGEAVQGCALAREQATAGADSRWPVMVAVCQLVAPSGPTGMIASGTTAAASLSLQLVEPLLAHDNPRLLAILRAVQDGKAVPAGNGGADALGGTVLAAYPAALWPAGALYLPDTVLRRLAVSDGLPPALRARAALQLAAVTGWPADGNRAWALAVAAHASATEPGGISLTLPAVLPDAVALARGAGSEISDTLAGAVNPAAAYVKAALRMGDVFAAGKALPQWQPNPARPADVRQHLQAELALAALKGNVDAGLWDAWLAAQPLQSPAGAQVAQRTLAALDGMGVGVPPSLWQALSDKAGPVVMAVDPAANRLLASAVAARDVPGILAQLSRAWGGLPAERVAPELAGTSVAALRAAGFGDLARRLAMEALLGSDTPTLRSEPARARKVRAVPVAEDSAMTGNLAGMGQGSARKGGMHARPAADMEIPMPRVPTVAKPVVTKPVAPDAAPADLMKDSY